MKCILLNWDKLIFLLIVLLTQDVISINEIEIASSRAWCWTKPVINDPSFILNPSTGGINWGFCKSGTITSNKKKEYFIYVSTSTLPESESSSTIMISLHGTESTSKELVLSNNGFKQGSYERIKIFSEDVGNLQSIKITNKGNQQYRCNTIKIESEMNYWNFECDKPIKCPRCALELSVVNLISYEITVKTSSMEDSGTITPIYITLTGTNGTTPKKLLADKGFPTGSLTQTSIDTVDVGNLYGIDLFINGYDNWRAEEIIVKKPNSSGGMQEKIFKNKSNIVLTNPLKGLKLTLPKPDSNGEEEVQTSNSNSLLDNKDQERVIKLSCTDILKDNENFGPTYVTSNVNYMMFLAECPSDCMRVQVRAIGLGIHPEESPICINALVDRAISFYGGILSVNIYGGLQSYTGGKKIFGIHVQGYGTSKRSYTIAKVDNIDMIAKDVRIIDYDGKTSYRGRVEVRNEGIWGSICAQGIDNSAAKIICKQIGYKEGKFLNPHESKGKNFCSNYEGVNYCGVQYSPILFSHLNCQGNEESIVDCYRKMADKSFCTHQYDALIECGNMDTEQYVTFDANTVRLMDSSNNPTQTGIGRLEILKGTWGTVCNTKFTKKSAQVICKQMGYIDGNMLGQPDSDSMCNNVLGVNHCGDFLQSIKLTEIQCLGHEKSVKDCKYSESTVACTHFNDVILKCDGYGDPSGKSQNIKKPKVLNPLIDKLPMPPTFNAKCDTTAKNIYFRGDPGSIFLVNCPADCLGIKSSIIGTGIYSIDSSICRAGLQSGVITNEGANLALVKAYGQNKYFSSNVRSISSLESNYMKISYFVIAPNSAYNTMIAMISNSFLELGNEEKLIEASNFGLVPFYDEDKIPENKGCLVLRNYNFYKDLEFESETGNLYSSFLETGSPSVSDVKAIYDWKPPNNEFKFDGISNFVDMYIIEAARKILDLKLFTIYFKLRMAGFSNKSQTLLSVGGCEGFSIIIDANDELIFDVKCGALTYKSGIYIPVNYNSHIAIVFDGSKLTYYLDGVRYSEVSTYFNLHYKKKIVIGKSSEYESDYFMGKIFFIAFFSESLGPKRNEKIFRYGYQTPDPIRISKSITLDNRVCLTSCANQPIPGVVGSPNPPIEAITYEIQGDKTIIAGSIGGTKVGSDNSDLNPFVEVKCSTTAREIFKGDIKIGDKKRIKCPSDCKNPKGLIYGTIIYSFDSIICNSAVHSGVIKKVNNAKILVKVLPGMTFYQGTSQYSLQSTSIDKSDYSFSIEEAPPIIEVDCKTTASQTQFSGTIGMKFLVKCPPKCSKVPHNVFGNELYSGDSSICQAAMHAGTLNDRGGEVQFIIEPGKKLYFGSKAFGIESKERDSYVKSIRFFNGNNNLFLKFKEEFNNKFITKNWEILDNLEASDYPSKWEYVPTPKNIKSSSKFLIHHAKKTRAESTLGYGSILGLRGADVVNSLYKLSFYFINLSPVGVIFRYKDDNNFYHLRINNPGPFKILLIKRYEGKSVTLASSNISITPRLWYTLSLYIYFDKFQINMQIGDLRNNQVLFEIIDNDIQRGALGIATDGNDDFYVNGIYVDNYEIDKSHLKNKAGSDVRLFDNILRENTPNHRSKYCKSLSEGNSSKEALLACKEFHQYCKLRCDESFHKRENILHFSCIRACIKDSILKEKLMNSQMNDEVSMGLNSDVWTPKEKEKCDFKPDDLGTSSYWIPCYITEVKNNPNDPEQKNVNIKYMIGGKTKIKSVVYPNIVLKKCGNMLKDRSDCNSNVIELPTIK